MGVRGLQSYIEKDCPDACKYVYIKTVSDKHRQKFSCQPTLVVDGMCMLNRFYELSSLEWIYGGQWLQFVSFLDNFITRFRSIGVKLVFIFDGTTCAAKREEWVRRRVDRLERVASIFQEIKKSFYEPDEKNFQLPTAMGTLVRFAVKEVGAEVYQTDRDADDVIAEYANKHEEVFGILSQDSDFVIYRTKMYLSLLHLDLQSLQTVHYDRDCFANKYLGLTISQLPLFACVNGNDFVPYDKLKSFHQLVSENGMTYMAARAKNLAEIIKKEKWTGDANNRQEMERIARMVFGRPDMAYVIQAGLKSYIIAHCVLIPKVCIKVDPKFEKAVRERHLNCKNTYIFNVMCKMEYEIAESLEDPECKYRPPSALIFRQIRQRCYSIIFGHYPSQKQVDLVCSKNKDAIVVQEWCAYSGNSMKQPEYIEPLPFQFYEDRILTIEDVWFKFSELEKLKLFWSILQVPMDFELLISIPKNLMVLACILNYLIGGVQLGPLLKPWEIAVFVAQALLQKSLTYLKKLKPPLVYADAVSLSSVFMRGVTTVLAVHATCDSPFPQKYIMPWRYFDGKLFHHVYAKTKRRPTIDELCCGQDDTVKGFYNLLSIVTRNTVYDMQKFDWRKILGGFAY